VVSEETIFRNPPIRNKNGLWWPCLLTDWDEMSNIYRRPSIDTSYQVSVHLAKRFERRFLQIGQSETRIACGDHVMDLDKMSNRHRGPSIDATYEISVLLGKRFQRIFFRNQPIKNKNGLWLACLLTDQN
jgi:hypothetical protein